MKIHLLLALLLLMPVVYADEDIFEEGLMITNYPENAEPGEEVTISFDISLESNKIKKLELPIEGIVFECPETYCRAEHTFEMPENFPLTLIVSLELEEPSTETPFVYDQEADFLWTKASSADSVFYLKRFTILPALPQFEVVESTPYLDREIVDELNRVTNRGITIEQFLKEKENGKELLVTKNVEFVTVETDDGRKVKSKWTITIEPGEGITKAENVYIFEDIPKEGAYTAEEIVDASERFTVLRYDPLVMWHFEEVSEPIKITYETDKASISGAATVVTAEKVRGSIWHIIIPIAIIPIIGFVLIYFGRFRKK